MRRFLAALAVCACSGAPGQANHADAGDAASDVSGGTGGGAGDAALDATAGNGGDATLDAADATTEAKPPSPPPDVPVTINGISSLTGSGVIYNGVYALHQTDFGFLWLDTSTLTAGHIEAEGYCVSLRPPSNSNLYVVGDCNGISVVFSSGDLVEAYQYSGQCGVVTVGCGGSQQLSVSRLFYSLGNGWSYLGDQDFHADIPNSTQATDPQGFTWTVQVGPENDLKHYIWHAN